MTSEEGRHWSDKVYNQIVHEHEIVSQFIRRKHDEGQITETAFNHVYNEPLTLFDQARFRGECDDAAHAVCRHITHVMKQRLLTKFPEWQDELQRLLITKER